MAVLVTCTVYIHVHTCIFIVYAITDCQRSNIGQLAWIIAVSIVGGVLLLGVVALCVAKIILMAIVRYNRLY